MDVQKRAEKLEDASIKAAEEGLKALLLLNGGASVAFLAFLADAVGSGDPSPVYARLLTGMFNSLVYFAAGAGFSVFCFFFSYYSNQQYASSINNPEKISWSRGGKLNIIGGFIALCSLVAFAGGVVTIWCVAPGFSQM